ncbi:BON domain-containing protein [bacterium M00.F.Ca.ET.228.01.1.1]|uniref:BON domain-containing protein n=1 Tax=Paraburkholderia phenoliruptrix TaxID=252970 RepID=UPI0010922F87|nr:BON domain-containing protein [Paraburkholderia phenoliruptrix]TGP45808.1 BON domain-containing protein [bacterium M00.F.Ca.ET.228.01.1.1]TGS04280.1 BON domain-containing protein [bacterium M00.F.Ca.ET.191.01.1.1]TGU07101.1 BON domain-containing protein [bacterium M00.F.Ca.ET.155.01.1.1]MBW0448493.1 BON domain-containing protein [Paraburkholderia phenoliruptrix]MBW9100645.1 BON domain-containing protein [Paraburkholderia phenoliruptrix]
MNLRQLVIGGSIAAVVSAFAYVPAFAAESANAAPDATVSTTAPAAPSKKAVRAANRAFSRTVQKSLQKTKGLDQTTITVFGNAKTGQVTLAGQISSEDQEGVAVAAAKQVHGVTSVSSKLTLREQGGG